MERLKTCESDVRRKEAEQEKIFRTVAAQREALERSVAQIAACEEGSHRGCSRPVKNSKLGKEQGEKPAIWQSPMGEVGMDLGDEDAISKMESEQMRQKLSRSTRSWSLPSTSSTRQVGTTWRFWTSARGRLRERSRRSGWQTRVCKE